MGFSSYYSVFMHQDSSWLPGWVSVLVLCPETWPSLGILFSPVLSQEANEEGQGRHAKAMGRSDFATWPGLRLKPQGYSQLQS